MKITEKQGRGRQMNLNPIESMMCHSFPVILIYISDVLKQGNKFLLKNEFVEFFNGGFDLDMGYRQPVCFSSAYDAYSYLLFIQPPFPPSVPLSFAVYFLTSPATFMCLSASTPLCTEERILRLS